MVILERFRFHPAEQRPGLRMAGFRLLGEECVELETESAPEGGWKVCSERRGVPLRAKGGRLRVLNLATGRDFSLHSERRVELIAAEKGLGATERRIAGLEAPYSSAGQ